MIFRTRNRCRITVKRYILAIAVLVLVAAGATSCWLRRDGRVNVLLIIVDTLRQDHLGCSGYQDALTPAIDALAEGGTRFSRVVTAAPVTAPSIATIFTSTYPFYHGIRDNEFFALNPRLPTIASTFQAAGYRTAAFVGSAVLDRRYGLASGFDHYDDDMSAEFTIDGESDAIQEELEQGVERRAENVTAAAIKWLRRHGKKNPFFCAVHYFDPHLGYNPPSPYRERFSFSPYDGEIAYTDSQIRVLLEALVEMGIRENTLIVFTADHGEGLGDHSEDSHGYLIYDSTVLVPLIFNLPGTISAGRVNREQVRTVDIMPTILGLTGLDTPETVQGASLAAALRDRQGTAAAGGQDAYIETFHTLYSYRWHELQGIRTASWKYVRAPQPELYDLQADPGEEINLFEERTEVSGEFEKALADIESGLSLGCEQFPAGRPEFEPEVMKKMKTLGYVGTDAQTRKKLPEPGGNYPDPKTKIGELSARHQARRLLRQAIQMNERGDADGAFETLASADSLSPDYAEVISLKGFILSRKGEFDEGIRLMERAVELSPGSKNMGKMLNNLGVAYFNQKDYKKAVDRFERALAISMDSDPHNSRVNNTLLNLGNAYLRLGDCANATNRVSRAMKTSYNQQTVHIMCVVYERCGHPGKAADVLERALRDLPDLDPDFVADSREKIRRLRAGEPD